MKRILAIGCLAGLAAGVAAALFAATAGRGPIRDAIALEDSVSHATSGAHHEDLFSRGVQEIGGAVGLVVFGLALGVVFSVVLAAVGPRLAVPTPPAASVRLGFFGFVAVVLVPFLKYPANPPAVGDPDTVNERTLLYFAALGLSILLTWAVWRFHRGVSLAPVAKAWATAALYGAGLVLIFLALPGNPDPVDAPADLVWRFRLASLGGLAAAWATLALVTGALLSRPAARN
ncbi:MAG: CbtA family protein [Acidimicrobiaceae bacterium]|nr:CbtA family protein [Acidimicrobiaceae bacterium]